MSRDRAWTVASALVLAALLGAMLLTLPDYGVTLDEGVQNRYGHALARAYATLGEDQAATRQNNLYLYGGFFELAAELARPLTGPDVYESRHLVTLLFGFVGFLAVWGLAFEVAGPAAGLLAILFLALTPEYSGQIATNPKDIPFASLYALGAWAALRGSRRRAGPWAVLATALAIGLAAGVRVAGIALVPMAAALWLARAWWERPGVEVRSPRSARRDLARVILASFAVLAVAWAVMVAVWPWAMLEPVRNPWRALGRFAQFWNPEVLWKGELVPADALPRSYVLQMLALKLPETYLVAAVLGGLGFVVLWPRRRRGLLDAGRRGRMLSSAWIAALALAPLAFIVAHRSPLYHGCRHVLFVIPFLAVLAALGVILFLRAGAPPLLRGAGATLLAAAAAVTATDMARLHPYEYVYFNRLVAGGLSGAAGRYETDYYLASYREGVEWVVAHYAHPPLTRPVRMTAPPTHFPFWHYAQGLDPSCFRTVRPGPNARAQLLFASASYRPHAPPGRIVHVVKRQGAPLLWVTELRAPR
jgi:hypothetical protein